MRPTVNEEIRNQVIHLLTTHSTAEIVKEMMISKSTVLRIKKQHGLTRTSKQMQEIRSRIRRKIIQDERRRIIFGTEQKTNLKLSCNRERHSLKYRLKRVGYKTTEEPNTFYIDFQTKRKAEYEELGKSLGIKFIET